jgi:hypothetical protein
MRGITHEPGRQCNALSRPGALERRPQLKFIRKTSSLSAEPAGPEAPIGPDAPGICTPEGLELTRDQVSHLKPGTELLEDFSHREPVDSSPHLETAGQLPKFHKEILDNPYVREALQPMDDYEVTGKHHPPHKAL